MYVHYAHGRKLFVAAVMSSPVWNYYDISSNNEKCTIDCKNSNKTLLQNQVPITVSFYSTQIDKKSLKKYIIYFFNTSKSMVLIFWGKKGLMVIREFTYRLYSARRIGIKFRISRS